MHFVIPENSVISVKIKTVLAFVVPLLSAESAKKNKEEGFEIVLAHVCLH